MLLERALNDGIALQKFVEIVRAHGGDASYITHSEQFPTAGTVYGVKAKKDGFIASMDCAVLFNILVICCELFDYRESYAHGEYLHSLTERLV